MQTLPVARIRANVEWTWQLPTGKSKKSENADSATLDQTVTEIGNAVQRFAYVAKRSQGMCLAIELLRERFQPPTIRIRFRAAGRFVAKKLHRLDPRFHIFPVQTKPTSGDKA